jgi:hypothetical protein
MTTSKSTENNSSTANNCEGFIPLIGGKELILSLGYPSAAAFRQAQRRGQLPIEVFSIPNRRGKFALRADFAHWLNSLKSSDFAKKGGSD